MVMKPFFLTICLMLSTASGADIPATEKTEIISLPKTPAIFRTASRLELDLLAERDGRIYIVVSAADLRRLEEEGLAYRKETERFAPADPSAETPPLSSPLGAFHTHRELYDDLSALAGQYPGLARLVTIGSSLENRPILALKISDNVAADEGEPAALFLGCHHAREWISVEVPFLLGKYLLENYAAEAEAKRLVDAAEIWIVPMVNPDGHDYSARVYRYWRKNRRDNGDGTFGVDPNRNYGFAWNYNTAGSSPNPASDVYRGTSAFSEPETRAVRDLILSRDFGALVSYHSFSQVIMYPWAYADFPTVREAEFIALTGQMAGLMSSVNGRFYLPGRSAGTMYTVNGDTADWAYAATGMAALCIELPPVETFEGAFFNAEEDIASIFAENLPGILHLIDWTLAHPHPVPETGLIDPSPEQPAKRRGPGRRR